MNEAVYKNFFRKDFRHDREMQALPSCNAIEAAKS
jgi:hypothetical protein